MEMEMDPYNPDTNERGLPHVTPTTAVNRLSRRLKKRKEVATQNEGTERVPLSLKQSGQRRGLREIVNQR